MLAARSRNSFAVLAALAASVPVLVSGVASARDDATEVCPGATTRDGVIVCDKLFEHGDLLRLPADSSESQRYGAVVRGGREIFTRSGNVPLSAAAAEQLKPSTGSLEYPRTVYLATIAGGEVTELAPKVRVAEDAILDAVFGGRVMEGTIGTASGKGRFNDTSKTLPVRIELAEHAAKGRLAGEIVNARRAIRASTGKCLPALSASKRRNPMRDGFSAKISLKRHPSMHLMFDDQMLVLWRNGASNMGSAFFPSMATLLAGDPLAKRWEASIHGVPWGGPRLKLRLVAAKGGERCR